MNRRFRLAAVERLRAIQLERSLLALAGAQSALVSAVTLRDNIAAELAVGAPSAGLPGDFVAAAAHRDRLREHFAQASGAVENARAGVVAAVAGWHGARAQLRAVEALHERHRETVQAHEAWLEQRASDELAGLRGHGHGLGHGHGHGHGTFEEVPR